MEDTEIINQLWQRRESALDTILQHYGRMLKNFAGHILPTAQDAEECVNDALLDVWNTIPPKRPASVASYAVMLTRRRSIDRIRRLNAKKRGGVCQHLYTRNLLPGQQLGYRQSLGI